MTYNEKLRKLREIKGLNRVEVEKLSGISYSCIKDLENGTSNPTIFTIETLCDFYGVHIYELLNPNLELNPCKDEIAKLRDLVGETDDVEMIHALADESLCCMLIKLGFTQAVEYFNCIHKWYS